MEQTLEGLFIMLLLSLPIEHFSKLNNNLEIAY